MGDGACARWARAAGVAGGVIVFSSTASASPSRIGVFGPSGHPLLARLERNVRSMQLEVASATVTLCTRDVVERLLDELVAAGALCTDGDSISVWSREGDRVVLKNAVVLHGKDDRSLELDAARATLTLNAGKLDPEDRSFTVVANEPPFSPAPPAAHAEAARTDRPSPPPVSAAMKRITPRLVVGLGPAVVGSRDGGSFGISGEVEIGVTRHVAIVPWVTYIPSERTAERPEGVAKYRPTLFGLGFAIPLLAPSSFVVPRFGAGYALLWSHVSPESAKAPSTTQAPEDLVAPVMYVNAALSFALASSFRLVLDGMFGTSSHDLVVRIGGASAAHWGVPIATLAMRGEWVLP